MARIANREPGDVYELLVNDRVAYAVYTHEYPADPKSCGLLRVFDGIESRPLIDLGSLSGRPVQSHYVSFIAAARMKSLRHVGKMDLPAHLAQSPSVKQGLPGRPPNYWTCQWTIERYGGEYDRIRHLPAHSVRLPESGIIGPLLLAKYIEDEVSAVDWLVPDNIDWTADTGGPLVLDGIAGYATWAEKPCELARAGDLIEIAVRGGYAYGLISHDHLTPPCWGPLLRVFRGVRKRRVNSIASLLRGEIQFDAFTLVTEGIRRELISVVANVDIPPRLRSFPPFKRQFQLFKNRTSMELIHRSWLLWTGTIDEQGDVEFFLLDQLPREYVGASFKEVMLPEKLIKRIETDWSPSDNVDMATVSDGEWRR